MVNLRKISSLSSEIRDNLFRRPEYVYIGRPGKWGNPYSSKENTIALYKVSSREESLQKYEEYLNSSGLINDIEELLDKTLVCWCLDIENYNPKKKIICHGQILQKYLHQIEQKQSKNNFDW